MYRVNSVGLREYPKGKLIPESLVKHVGTGDIGVLTFGDRERYIRTVGVSTCTGLVLDFPQSKIVALAHIAASGSLHQVLQQIKTSLEGRTNESPYYFIEEGPYKGPRIFLDETYYQQKDPRITRQYFPGTQPSPKVIHDTILKGDESLDIMVDKETGVIHVYNGNHRSALLAVESDFQIPDMVRLFAQGTVLR